MTFSLSRRNFSTGAAALSVLATAVTTKTEAKADDSKQSNLLPTLVSALPITPNTFADVRYDERLGQNIVVTSTRAIGAAKITMSNATGFVPTTYSTFFALKNVAPGKELSFEVSCLEAAYLHDDSDGFVKIVNSDGTQSTGFNIVCAEGLFGVPSFSDGIPHYGTHDEALKIRPSLN